MSDGHGSDAEFGDLVRRIGRDARERNRGRATELAALVADSGNGAALTEEARDRALTLAHQLRGSAGTFGYLEAATTAQQIQRLLHEHPVPTRAQRTHLARLVGDLCAALEQEPGSD